MRIIEVITQSRNEMVNITDLVQSAVGDLDIIDGQITLYAPHTTCGLILTENADPDVGDDLMAQLDNMVPWSQGLYKHRGGNSAAHIKAALVGCSLSMLVEGGDIKLGVWQGIYLCEFDGPRTRHVWVG